MKKQNQGTAKDKALAVVRIVASVCVLILAVLQLTGVWDRANNLTMPLMGAVLLLQAVQEWKRQRGVAVFLLCAASFIFACTLVVWFA